MKFQFRDYLGCKISYIEGDAENANFLLSNFPEEIASVEMREYETFREFEIVSAEIQKKIDEYLKYLSSLLAFKEEIKGVIKDEEYSAKINEKFFSLKKKYISKKAELEGLEDEVVKATSHIVSQEELEKKKKEEEEARDLKEKRDQFVKVEREYLQFLNLVDFYNSSFLRLSSSFKLEGVSQLEKLIEKLVQKKSSFRPVLYRFYVDFEKVKTSGLSKTASNFVGHFLSFFSTGIFFMIAGFCSLAVSYLLIQAETHTAFVFVLVVLGIALVLFGTGTQGAGELSNAQSALKYKVSIFGGAGVLAFMAAYGIVLKHPEMNEAFAAQTHYLIVKIENTESGQLPLTAYEIEAFHEAQPLHAVILNDKYAEILLKSKTGFDKKRSIDIDATFHLIEKGRLGENIQAKPKEELSITVTALEVKQCQVKDCFGKPNKDLKLISKIESVNPNLQVKGGGGSLPNLGIE